MEQDEEFKAAEQEVSLDYLEELDKRLALDANDVGAWHDRSLVLYELEMYDEAVVNCDRALAIDPMLANIWVIRGLALSKLERYQEAADSYDKARPIDTEPIWAANPAIEKDAALDKLAEWLKTRRPPPLWVAVYELLAPTEKRLHLFIGQRLQQALGEGETEWWFKSIDPKIRKKCVERREEDPRRQDAYCYTDLIDLKEILDKNWRLFEADFQRVKGRVKSKKEFLDSLVRLNEIRKSVMHPVRGAPTEDDKAFASHMREIIQSFSNTG